jgi:hypothetical protein
MSLNSSVRPYIDADIPFPVDSSENWRVVIGITVAIRLFRLAEADTVVRSSERNSMNADDDPYIRSKVAVYSNLFDRASQSA